MAALQTSELADSALLALVGDDRHPTPVHIQLTKHLRYHLGTAHPPDGILSFVGMCWFEPRSTFMRMFLLFASVVTTLTAAGSQVQATPLSALDSLTPATGTLHAAAYRTVCDRYGERCRRVWIDDGYRARDRDEYGSFPRGGVPAGGTYLGTIREGRQQYYGAPHRAAPVPSTEGRQ